MVQNNIKEIFRRGFTLIELLIVVAIIAILAAIAVPNFLEAQTRAKVSRVKSDMRALAPPLEAYYVDNNQYPPDYSHINVNPQRYRTFIGRLSHLTTPIAYITSLPTDIFAIPVAEGSALPTSPAPYREGGTTSGDVIYPVVFDYAAYNTGLPQPPFINDNRNTWAEITQNPDAVAWALNSPGPDVTNHTYLGFSNLVIYDPTNGTVSEGQIIRTNISAEDQPSE